MFAESGINEYSITLSVKDKSNNTVFIYFNEIFRELSTEDYEKAFRMLEFFILATDLALYFKYVFFHTVCVWYI